LLGTADSVGAVVAEFGIRKQFQAAWSGLVLYQLQIKPADNMTLASSIDEKWQKVRNFAQENETSWARDPVADAKNWGIHLADPPPWNRLLGPVFERGEPSGIVNHKGVNVCQWGTPERPDLTFSIAKTYLALLAGIAHDQGLLPDVHAPVLDSVPGIGFESEQNRAITWHQLLQQTSEYRGVVFDIDDQVDHYRRLSFEPPLENPNEWPAKGSRRPAEKPGTYWEYNDVRINQLSLALAHLFGQALPTVFSAAIAEPLGLSNTWHWHGYENSWIELNGQSIQSVPGGSHWGGGVRISAADQLLIARLMLNNGQWAGRQLLSSSWIEKMRVPCDIAPFYGYLLWLNHNQQGFPSAPASAYLAIGAGSSVIAHLPEQDLIIVTRWIQADAVDGLIGLVRMAIDR